MSILTLRYFTYSMVVISLPVEHMIWRGRPKNCWCCFSLPQQTLLQNTQSLTQAILTYGQAIWNKVEDISCFNPFQNNPWFLRVCRTGLLKTLWEKEKLLITSNFSFSHSVFYLFGEPSAIFIKFKIVVCKHFHFGRVRICCLGKS